MPPGRLGYDLRADLLLLHTVVDAAVHDALAEHGVVRPDESLCVPEFAESYAWMRSRHDALVPGSSGGPLLWFWARTTRRELLARCREAPGADRPRVLLTCRVPRDRVLLSDFLDWHHALNRFEFQPPWLSEEEAERRHDAFCRELDELGLWNTPTTGWPPDLRERVHESWAHMFDVQRYPRRNPVQAVAEYLRAEEVEDEVLLVR